MIAPNARCCHEEATIRSNSVQVSYLKLWKRYLVRSFISGAISGGRERRISMRMHHPKWGLLAGAAVALSVAAFTASNAAPAASGAATLNAAAPSDVVEVAHWRRRHRWGWAGAGFATGLALGALAPRPYYYDPYYYYGYYGPPPVVYAPPPRVYIDPNGPLRQCWVPTDPDRGYGYYVPC
jgi:hypothetical protein